MESFANQANVQIRGHRAVTCVPVQTQQCKQQKLNGPPANTLRGDDAAVWEDSDFSHSTSVATCHDGGGILQAYTADTCSGPLPRTKNPHQAGILSTQHEVAQADFFFGAAFLAAAGLAAADLTVVDLVTVDLAPTTAGDTVCARALP